MIRPLTRSAPRRARRSGTEAIEFALAGLFMAPVLLGSFITGMNLIRSIQVNQMASALAGQYILGAEYSSYGMQRMAQRLASGMDLQIGNSFTGNVANNTGNGGRGLVTISQIMWIGGPSSSSCLAVGSANCTNQNSFVFLQRIRFGNGSLVGAPDSLGTPAGATINALGDVANYVTNAAARLPSTGQSAMQALWQVSGGGRTPLVDKQVVFVVEVYFPSPDLSLGSIPGQGVYARCFY